MIPILIGFFYLSDKIDWLENRIQDLENDKDNFDYNDFDADEDEED
jgi:hypothetical protein